ncbi:MAG: esterase/lipase family protein [Paludibacter sp.]
MRKIKYCIFILLLISTLSLTANHKVYIIHGYGGLGIEMQKIQQAIEKKGYTSEIYTYLSLVNDVDSVGKMLFNKIQYESFDTVSFVTHSMGALVVRSIYEHLDSTSRFPFIYRFVMIAPPNNGSPVADFFAQFEFAKTLGGPNLENLTTDTITGAPKYPIPTCEIGLIAGSYGGNKGFNIFVKGDNDGVLLPQSTKMGIEKDVVFIKSWHVGLLFDKKVIMQVMAFLKNGRFKK